jgi:hydroxymethylpyrimidine/phosphomethylpyrimidine kinase
MNIRYRSDILSLCERIGYKISTFNRTDEPTKVSTMDWGTTNALKKSKTCPDIIYDKGGIGKEPMIRILGTNPDEVFMKLMKIVNEKKK